jgi:chemotaxis protein MotB
MKTVAGLVLAVLLVAAIIFGVVIHGRYSDTRDALLISEKNSSELNEKVALLTEEVSSLSEKLREREGVFTELEKAQTRISGLEDALKMKDGRVAELQEELRLVKGDLEKERKAEEALRNELSAKETVTAELQEKLRDSESRILALEQENARQQDQVDELRDQLSDLEGEKGSVENKVDRLQTTYDALISDLKEQIEKREVTIEAFEKRISVSFVDRILFDFGKETITPDGREVLEKVGGILKGVQDRQIRVIGHTDDIPILPEYRYRFPSNWELSAARAAAVVRHFERETGLDPRNLEAVGRSFYHPVASNETADGRSQNRRVEIIIAPKSK